jgi:hypothetical protein
MAQHKKTPQKWSQEVTDHSDALDLEEGIFAKDDPAEIAKSLKRSAEHSKRRKGSVLQSAVNVVFEDGLSRGNLDETVAAIMMRLCGRDGSQIVAARQAMQGQFVVDCRSTTDRVSG